MEFSGFDIQGPILIAPQRFEDARGYFVETFKTAEFSSKVSPVEFVQDNESLSTSAGTIRGLHYQSPPYAQGKLVRCVRGKIIDVAVDFRTGSPTFMKHIRAELTGANGHQLWVPSGFLHGFAALVPDTLVSYKVTEAYNPEHDRAVAFDDPLLDIDWGLNSLEPIVSPKDRNAPSISQIISPFKYRNIS